MKKKTAYREFMELREAFIDLMWAVFKELKIHAMVEWLNEKIRASKV